MIWLILLGEAIDRTREINRGPKLKQKTNKMPVSVSDWMARRKMARRRITAVMIEAGERVRGIVGVVTMGWSMKMKLQTRGDQELGPAACSSCCFRW